MKYILFVCGHNAGRSQMAEAYFNYHNENPEVCAISAGTNPAQEVNPEIVELLSEFEIPFEKYAVGIPKKLTPHMVDSAEKIYTMGCNVDCAHITKEVTADFGLEDPHGKNAKEVTHIFLALQKAIDPILIEYNS